MKYPLRNGCPATMLCVERLNFTQDVVDLSSSGMTRAGAPRMRPRKDEKREAAGFSAKPAPEAPGGLSRRAFRRQACRHSTQQPDFDWRPSHANRHDCPENPTVRAAARSDRG